MNFLGVWRKDSDQAVTRIILEPGGDKVFSDFSELKRVEILVGPEGGLSKDELSEAKLLGASLLSLGSRILRAETAPVVALSLLQYLHGDMGR
jgi:16S rRNA (uracil1498-N3)-methyltransferase